MSFLIKILSAILALFIFSSSGDIASYAPIDKDNMKLSFTVISDGHMEGNEPQKHKNYGEGFCDMASAEVMSRALIMVGDNTMNSQVVEQAMLYGLMNKYNEIENVFMAVGNHDICPAKHNRGDYDTLKKRFMTFNNAFLDNEIENLYYSAVIDGYHFIVLASDDDAGLRQYISPEQFAWLDEELKAAEESGNPVFLFSHWPLNDVFEGVWDEGHVGDQSDELKEVLKKYDNRIFFFTGHLHMGFFDNGYGIEEDGDITYINVPSFGSVNDVGEADHQETGMGYLVEVYEEEIVLRVRNFVAHEWTEFEYHLDI